MEEITENQQDGGEETDEKNELETGVDSKYRKILIAAQRSKQLQRGAKPRVTLDAGKHKPTRIALDEVDNEKVGYKIIDEE